MKTFTGIVNVQCRGTKIIEVGLRLARGGSYFLTTDNRDLIENINKLVNYNEWDYNKLHSFEPFYSFKCFSRLPVLYVLPQYVINWIFKNNDLFYDYYFEPAGGEGDVFFQFSHRDFDEGMKQKKHMENLNIKLQVVFLFAIICSIILFFINPYIGVMFALIIFICYLTRFLNPLSVSFSWIRIQLTKLGL